MNKDENSAYMRAWDEHSAIKWTHVPRRAQVSRYSEARNIYVDFFVFFVLRHWSVSQVFTPKMSQLGCLPQAFSNSRAFRSTHPL